METQNNDLMIQVKNFLVETLQRFFTKSPKYFVILQWISGIALLITLLPELLQNNGIVLPSFLAWLANPILISIAGTFLAAFRLTAQSKATGVLENGAIVKKTDAVALPFTAAVENKAAEIASIPEVKVVKV